MNIVYGGSFNPPTKAHERIVNLLQKKFKPQNIIIVPTASNYTWKNVPSFKHRYNMCCIAFKKALVSDIENKNLNYKGTLFTLETLSKTYDDIYFCMGADNILQIKKWINYEILLKKFHFIILGRNGIDVESFVENNLKEYKDRFIFIDLDIDISSSMYRNTKDISLISEEVLEYIKKNNLEDIYE